jgi:hypothetical protein
MKQLTATNHMNGMTIIQRYVEGARYLKVTPKNLQPLVVDALKKQFGEQPIDIETSETGWVKIVKKERNEELEKKMKEEGIKEEDVDEDYVLNKEAEMLKNQGFAVKIEEIK